MRPEIEFGTDLYRGTAYYYDRYRPAYADVLLDDLRRRVPISGKGRLLDLACGTGQIAVPLAGDFAEVLAVDQEPESVAYGRAKARAAGLLNITWLEGSAETIALDGPFELVAVGTAFHRLKRAQVARRMHSWVRPGGAVALLWSETPSEGDAAWQLALQELLAEWMGKVGTSDRIPVGWMQSIAEEPHEQVLCDAGFDYVGKFAFAVDQVWTVESLAGFVYSTSMLNRRALGDRAPVFERDLADRLGKFAPDGVFRQTASHAYELARRLK